MRVLGTQLAPCPLGEVQSPGAGPGEGKSSRWWCFGAPTEAGRNPGGILISCQSKQKHGEVMRYLLPPLDPAPPARPPPQPPSHGVCRAQRSRALPGANTPAAAMENHRCPVAPVQQRGQVWGSHSQHSPGAQRWPRTLQRPLDEAFAVVGNGFSEDFVCQRRKLGWNLQEESLKGMAKNYYISFPEGASSCAGAQRHVSERHKRGEYPKEILGEGSLSREKFGNSQTPLPASVCS